MRASRLMQLIRSQPAQLGSPHVLSGEELARGVTDRVVSGALDDSFERGADPLLETVHETLHSEQARLDRGPATPRDAGDGAFLAHLRHALARADEPRERALVREIVERYVEEISGHFDPRVYAVRDPARPRRRSGAPPRPRSEGRRAGAGLDVDDRVLIGGELGAAGARRASAPSCSCPRTCRTSTPCCSATRCTGWAFRPVAYGAGLNLFTSRLIGYFMRNVGALHRGPEEERSALSRDAQGVRHAAARARPAQPLLPRRHAQPLGCRRGAPQAGAARARRRSRIATRSRRRRTKPRIFVVPCTLTYPLVLEAATLAGDYLRARGRAPLRRRARRVRAARPLGRTSSRSLLELDLSVHVQLRAAHGPVRQRGRRGRHVARSARPCGRPLALPPRRRARSRPTPRATPSTRARSPTRLRRDLPARHRRAAHQPARLHALRARASRLQGARSLPAAPRRSAPTPA